MAIFSSTMCSTMPWKSWRPSLQVSGFIAVRRLMTQWTEIVCLAIAERCRRDNAMERVIPVLRAFGVRGNRHGLVSVLA